MINLGAIEALSGPVDTAAKTFVNTAKPAVRTLDEALKRITNIGQVSALGSNYDPDDETKEKVQKITNNTELYAAYGKAGAVIGREAITGLIPDSAKEWFAENQPYSGILLGAGILSAIPGGRGLITGMIKAPYNIVQGFYEANKELGKSMAS
jgi:hypothetical protein